MRLAVAFASAGLLLSTTASAQQPEISLQVMEMSPSSPAGLHKNDHLYLRIHYQTNVQMWIRPVYSSGGARLKKALTNPQWLLDPGEGTGFAWPVWGIVRWRGGWRIAAAIPAAALVLWRIKDVIDIIGGFLILPYMLLVTLVRRVRLKGRTNG